MNSSCVTRGRVGPVGGGRLPPITSLAPISLAPISLAPISLAGALLLPLLLAACGAEQAHEDGADRLGETEALRQAAEMLDEARLRSSAAAPTPGGAVMPPRAEPPSEKTAR